MKKVDVCPIDVVIKYDNIDLCGSDDECKYNFAVHKGDTKYCEMISEIKTFKTDCYGDIAIKNNDEQVERVIILTADITERIQAKKKIEINYQSQTSNLKP